ncbi:DUF2752 domain-containing protein [Ilyomonas limi]
MYVLYFFNPLRYAFYPPCLFKKITTLDCPGCGSARALHSVLHGNILKAADYNLLVVLFMPVVICGLLYFCTGRGERLWRALNKPLLYFLIICTFFILRNINIYPFTFLSAGK